MRKIILLHLFFCAFACITHAQKHFFDYYTSQSPTKAPLHEVRAVWLTTIGGIDWPHSYSQSELSSLKQKKELCDILDKLVDAGFNTVLLQTRIRATTIFPSSMEPWDGCLSGFPGKSPGYDALSFAIDECHKRGMKLHAWVVSIPVGKWNGTGCKNLRNTYPNLLKKIGDEGFMNPESAGTADYLARFCKDITKRYDIDGIHLDYIRYPETWKGVKDKYAARENITRIVRAVHDAVKAEKPWVMMSCSPVGKYADTKRMWSHGWNARDVNHQDAAQWLQNGLMDALFPMMYFRDENFYPFAIDWQERSDGKIIVPGLGIYFLSPREKNWSLEDITREMHVTRQYGMGTCMFRSKFFTDNTKGLYDYTKTSYSPQPALQPVMNWYNVSRPTKPSELSLVDLGNEMLSLSWKTQNDKDVNGNAYTYNIYGSDINPVNTKEADNLLAGNIINKGVTMKKSKLIRYFAVTASDRYGNESEPVQLYPTNDDMCDNEGKMIAGRLQRPTLPYDGRRIILNGTDVYSNQLVILTSAQGIDQTSFFTKSANGDIFIEAANLTAGVYTLSIISKKGYRHIVGCIDIPVK